LSRQAGNLQDLAVLEFIRRCLGPECGIGADANNGYTPEFTRWLLEEAGGLNLAFVEEMFPEDTREYLALKEFIRSKGLKALVADGENWHSAEDARPFVAVGAIDLLQGDVVQFQFEGILEEAALARASGARVAPHNWGSEFGFCNASWAWCSTTSTAPNATRAAK
jgi:L-alanine-DL-glutamate epimerase-like enolase superfamily enzyme